MSRKIMKVTWEKQPASINWYKFSHCTVHQSIKMTQQHEQIMSIKSL